MIWVFVIMIICFSAGIIFLGKSSPFRVKTRQEYLQEMASFIEGNLEPIPEKEDSFRIIFNFERNNFSFEDVVEKGFRGDINKAFLRKRIELIGGKKDEPLLFLVFTEKKKGAAVRSETLIVSDIPNDFFAKNSKVQIPEVLVGFDVQTNNKKVINKLFANRKAVDIFKKYISRDHRGNLRSSLKIVDGYIILEFLDGDGTRSNLSSLKGDIPSLEDYLDDLIFIVDLIKK